jgi:hypothetical protein
MAGFALSANGRFSDVPEEDPDDMFGLEVVRFTLAFFELSKKA